ncbi:MAG: hypothetical protein HKN19_09060, partial [Halioglobus sp.]|nr:hypothetical protein [Halioglobus sp.]
MTTARVLALTGALLLAACGSPQVVVEGQFPAPLMDPKPLDIGVWYTQEFRNHVFSEEGTKKRGGAWVVETGAAQVQMWDRLFAGMFENIVYLAEAPGATAVPGVDAVLIPQVAELQYAIPAHTNVKVYEIWMRYRFQLVTPTGDALGEWEMTSYGKTPTAFLQSDEAAVNGAAIMALRDAGANFATSFDRVPAVKEWLSQH